MRWALASVILVPRGTWGKIPSTRERRRVIEWARLAGFAGIELSPRWVDFHKMDRRRLQDLRAEVADAGLEISGLNLSRCILTRTAQASEHLDRLRRSVAVAESLGAEVINVSLSMPTPPGPDRAPLHGWEISDAERQQSVDVVADVAHRALQVGITLSLELHDDGLLDTPELCLRFLEYVGARNVGVNPDLGNLCRGPAPLADWKAALMLLAPRTVWWHLKNYRNGRPVPVWDGDIDYDWAFGVMHRVRYAGWVSIESHWGDLESQKQDLEYLKRLQAISASAPAD